jgi:hypothetical protein
MCMRYGSHTRATPTMKNPMTSNARRRVIVRAYWRNALF